MPFGFHGLDLVVILVIALLIFGPKKLPEMGASIGKSIKEFQKGMREVTGGHKDDDDDDDDVESRPVSSKDMKKLKGNASSTPAPKSSISDMSSPTEHAIPEMPAEATEDHHTEVPVD
ncbi:MAG TPA: twin-arginine translocase TatA/TatE family subunit [Ktedonobacteraceae bacterium]